MTVNTLKAFNATRYAALDWPYMPFVPGGNNAVYEGITFDIAAQIGALFKDNGPASPTHDLNVERVFEAGFSQDGAFTFTQAETFHALDRMPGGGPIYDGYVPGGTRGSSSVNFGLTPAGTLPPCDPRVQMQPRDVPVIHIDTETEVAIGVLVPNGLAYRRDDSDARDDSYRLWEVPGSSHVSNDHQDEVLTLSRSLAELFGIPIADLPPIGCAHQQFVAGPTIGVPGVIDLIFLRRRRARNRGRSGNDGNGGIFAGSTPAPQTGADRRAPLDRPGTAQGRGWARRPANPHSERHCVTVHAEDPHPHGVRCHIVEPAFVRTDLMEKQIPEQAGPWASPRTRWCAG